MKKQLILGLILAGVIALVFFLTFQGSRETISLSEMVRAWAIRLGYKGDPLKFRSDFHIVEYFVVGIAAAIFAKGLGWRAWIPGVFASTIGLLDETIPNSRIQRNRFTKGFLCGLGSCIDYILDFTLKEKKK